MPKTATMIAIGLIFFAGSHSFAVEPEFVKAIEPELLEISEFEFVEATEFEFVEVTEFEIAGVTDQEFFVPSVSSDGLTVLEGEGKSLQDLMCAPLKGFSTPQKCLFEGQ
jgi:hypothetical protein